MKWMLTFALAAAVAVIGWMISNNAGSAQASSRKLIHPGQSAPDFTAISSVDGQALTLSNLRGQSVILVFYPMDNTPGCTVQLCSLRDQWDKLKSIHATVLGINSADLGSHQKFAKTQHYPYPLLVDKDRAIAKAFGVGDLWTVNTRTVIIVDPKGVVRYVREGMPPVTELIRTIEAFSAKP